jgi:hypothetical protein
MHKHPLDIMEVKLVHDLVNLLLDCLLSCHCGVCVWLICLESSSTAWSKLKSAYPIGEHPPGGSIFPSIASRPIWQDNLQR